MDDLNLFHVLGPNIQDIGHGVRLSRQDEIPSRTLVCFLDGNGEFHYGFGFRNGSNFRVVCWENGARIDRTVPKGAFIIAFDEETAENAFDSVNANDFDSLAWFDGDKTNNVRDELIALNDKRDMVNNLIARIPDLTIQEIAAVNQKIDELKEGMN